MLEEGSIVPLATSLADFTALPTATWGASVITTGSPFSSEADLVAIANNAGKICKQLSHRCVNVQ